MRHFCFYFLFVFLSISALSAGVEKCGFSDSGGNYLASGAESAVEQYLRTGSVDGGDLLVDTLVGGVTGGVADNVARGLRSGAGASTVESVRAPPERLQRDIDVNPVPPKPLKLDRPIGLSPTQNARAQRDIERLERAGAKEMRVNQQQVNAAGQRVGWNRPDFQYTNRRGQRRYVEYEKSSSNRGPGHEKRLKANDPDGRVRIIVAD